MDAAGWIVTGFGFALLATAANDVVATTFHPDHEGRLSRILQRLTWRLHIAIARRLSEQGRRRVLAAAGPTLMVTTLAMWVGLFILAFALMVWPHLDAAYTSDRIEELGFADAVYYSGITGTVLGYGDITPVHWLAKLAAFVESGAGFALLTLIVTHLLTVIDGIGRRDQVSLDVWGESGGTFDGVAIVERSLRSEGADAVRERLENLARGTRMMQERFHRFPMLVFYIRSADPVYDPERTVKAIGDAALAGHVAAATHPQLGIAADHLERALRHFTRIVAEQYMGRARRRLDDTEPDDADHAGVRDVAARLGVESRDLREIDADRVASLARHTRAFLEELDGLTHWQAMGR